MASRTHTRLRRRLHRTFGLAGTAAVVAGLLTVVGAPSALGASEVYYAAPHGTGDCLAEEQACSLSEALDASIAADAVIHLVADADGTTRFDTTSGWDIDVDGVASSTRTLTIEPAPEAEGTFTLDGVDTAPYILWVHPGVVLSLTGVTVANSSVNAIFSGPLRGGGIHNELGDVTVTRVTFSGNRVNASGSGLAYGGGIYNEAGTITVQDSTFRGNLTNASGSGFARGGGLYNAGGTATVKVASFSDDTSNASSLSTVYGGGIHNERGAVIVEDSTFSSDAAQASDSANAHGGGIYNDHGMAGVENSAFSGAAATYSGAGAGTVRGGGIYSDNAGDAAGTRWLTVRHSTLSGNASGLTTAGSNVAVISSTFASNGRGIVLADGAVTPAAVVSSTLVGNANGALVGAGSGTVLAGSLLADNGAANCAASETFVHDGGYNLADDDSCWSEDGSAAETTRTVARAKLALSGLAANGGRTSTILPGAASVANGVIPANTVAPDVVVDGGPVSLCGVADGSGAQDQRGVPRPLAAGRSCAVGAVDASLPSGAVGASYVASLPTPAGLEPAASGGVTGVPSGLRFDPVTGRLDGVPTSAGSSEIVVTYGGAASALPEEALSYRFTLAISASAAGGAPGFAPGPVTDEATALAAKCDSAPFRDVTPINPFCSAIAWLTARQLTTGYRDGTFRPAGDVSRAAAAVFLYRLAHQGTSVPPCDVAPFRDVSVKNPFCGAIDWLMNSRITTGYEDGTFQPNAPASRAATAAFLYRYAQADRPGSAGQTNRVCNAGSFIDVPEHAAFCTAITWLKAAGITTGFSDRTFRPGSSTSRGAFAAFLSRYAL